jgi:hypothetical protein
MGKWYGPGGASNENTDTEGRRNDRVPRTGTAPCPNGVLLTDPNAQFDGTKMTDSLGRVWGCPSTIPTAEKTTTIGEQPTLPLISGDATATTPGGGGAAGGGLWSMSPELQSIYGNLLTRANEIFNTPYGYDPKALQYMFGQGFEGLRGNEAATRNTLMEGLSRVGMLNTGAGQNILNQNAWNTANGISNLMRDIYIKNEEQKKTDMMNQNQLFQSFFGTGLGAEQITEFLNAQRRGEAQDFWNSLMSFLATYKA